jgi:hypothetical protein
MFMFSRITIRLHPTVEHLFVRCSRLLLFFCIFVTGCTANSQQKLSEKAQSKVEITAESKKKLAKEVLSEIEIAKQYDLYLNNSIDITISASRKNEKLRKWLQSVLAKEAGWKHIENQYITQLEANFSEAELTELLNQSKQPLMKKLLQAEIQAYTNASEERRKLLDKVWNDYNSGIITPPPEVLP